MGLCGMRSTSQETYMVREKVCCDVFLKVYMYALFWGISVKMRREVTGAFFDAGRKREKSMPNPSRNEIYEAIIRKMVAQALEEKELEYAGAHGGDSREEMAQYVGKCAAELGYDIQNVRFITSGMKRTNETLKILFGDVPFEVDPRFREVDFGIFEMHSYEELKDTPAYQQWLTGDNEANVPPEGESGVQMTERVLKAFSEIREDTVIITHGGVIAAIMGKLFPGENKNRYQWQPKPGQGYTIEQSACCRLTGYPQKKELYEYKVFLR